MDRIAMPERVLVAGRYRLTERLGSGTATVTWSAHDERLDRVVAVRQLVVAPGPGALADLAADGRVVDGLGLPAVAAVRDVVVDAGASWLVRDHVPGRGLDDAVAHRGMDPDRVARIGVELADALAALHAAGVRHGRVSAANVLLDDDGAVTLTDVGVARVVPGGAPVDAALDVRALARVLSVAARPSPLADVLAVAAPDATTRPTAARMRDLLRAFSGRRRAYVSLATVAVLGAGAIASGLGGGDDRPRPASTAPAPPAAVREVPPGAVVGEGPATSSAALPDPRPVTLPTPRPSPAPAAPARPVAPRVVAAPAVAAAAHAPVPPHAVTDPVPEPSADAATEDPAAEDPAATEDAVADHGDDESEPSGSDIGSGPSLRVSVGSLSVLTFGA